MPDSRGGIQLLPESRRKLEIQIPGENRPLVFGAAFLVLVLVVFFLLNLYFSYLQNQLTDLNGELTGLEQKRDKKFEQDLLTLEKRLQVAGKLIDNHLIWSRGLRKIEALTPPGVLFSFLSAVAQDHQLDIKATAVSYTIIARHIASLSGDETITDVILNKVTSLPTGFLEYDLRVIFDQNKLILNPPSEKKAEK